MLERAYMVQAGQKFVVQAGGAELPRHPYALRGTKVMAFWAPHLPEKWTHEKSEAAVFDSMRGAEAAIALVREHFGAKIESKVFALDDPKTDASTPGSFGLQGDMG
ncbi:MAG: hypothetical protein ABFD89_17615 [Bryobacteraceae bacterium]